MKTLPIPANAHSRSSAVQTEFSVSAGAKSVAPVMRIAGPQDEAMASQEPIPPGILVEAVKKANRMAAVFNREVHFQIHEGTGRIMVEVINRENQEVIAEIPPKKLLDTLAAINEAIGMILDHHA